MKQEDDTSFPVKIQGAGVEPFEMQVENQTAVFSLFLLILLVKRLDNCCN